MEQQITGDYILAVDVGTSGVKALAVSPAGTIRQQARAAYASHHPQTGFATQDPDEILRQTRHVLVSVRAACGQLPLAIVWSSAMHGVMAVDSEGQALTPLITWADLRSIPQARELIQTGVADAIFQVGGTPIHPMAPLCKLMWLRLEAPDVFRAAHKFVSVKEYILFRLTGSWQVDYSIASATALFHTRHLRWHDDALRLAGINGSKLSDPVPTTSTATIQTDWLGHDWRGIPLVFGASDGCLAQLGSGATAPGALSVTIGTSSAVRELVTTFAPSVQSRLFCYYLRPGQFVRGGASNNGTNVIEWLQRAFSPAATGLDELATHLNHVPAGAEGLLCLPFFFGERAPHYNPHAKGVFFGITSAHAPVHFQRAAVEGICFAVKSLMEAIHAGAPRGIYLSGGFTKSATLVQLLANVIQVPVRVCDTPEASAMGAAELGFAALGVDVRWTKVPTMVCQPNAQTTEVYTRLYELYQSLCRNLEPLFETSDPHH